MSTMGTPSESRRTERVLADAARKVSKAEETLHTYREQEAEALEKKRVLEEEHDQLRQSILTNALAHASPDLRREHAQLRQTLDSYQSKIDQMREISLLSARVVDSRIKTKQGRQYVEYKLQIETDIRGTLVLWHRYSTFLNLAATLKAKNPHTEHVIPELQTQSLTGFFSDQLILDRIAKLNEFLDVVTKAEEFQWGIRIDKDTCVYKRKTKRNSSGDRSDRSYSIGRESIASLAATGRDSLFLSPGRESMMANGL
ncbi:hypothetical protein Poli38472_005631 [Pythium oligandrum]|uniref:PX domain-containing protein n=1 Tax=Pythium oligandrum TaxID=41045 RepID=A0A8K1FLT6_PYTOL|nr:hypothetical protein Poli38472_005631 [Pythium oligandrum]|eukprot:TMW63013.1 hypothetical protein Poli38472_005631 [Pythium oligandrum]